MSQAIRSARPARPGLRWWVWGLLFVGGATILGVADTVQYYYGRVLGGHPVEVSFWVTLRYWLPDWYLWAGLTPAIIWLSRRYPIESDRWLQNLLRHVGFGAGFALLELALSCTVISLIAQIPQSYGGSLRKYWLGVVGRFWFWELLIYLMILAAVEAYQFFRKYQERQLATSELQAQLSEAQLRALRMQLHPHFLFNALHSIAVLLRKGENGAALGMLTGLGDLLRYSLDNDAAQEVPLRQEMDFIQRYLRLEQVRFQDRLRVEYDIPDATLSARVPNLILQPLVENAIRHGVAPRPGARTVRLSAAREGEQLRLDVEDVPAGTGDKARPAAEPEDEVPGRPGGLGLANVRARLRRLYGEDFEMQAESDGASGYRVTLRIPFRPGEDVAAGEVATEMGKRGSGRAVPSRAG